MEKNRKSEIKVKELEQYDYAYETDYMYEKNFDYAYPI
jgi:hypothetical protein